MIKTKYSMEPFTNTKNFKCKMNKSKTVIIINPKSGKKRFLSFYLPIVKKLYTKYDVKYDIVYTSKSGDASKIATFYKDNVDFITIFGGDGTIRETLEGLKDKPIPIGIIPFGTVNVLALDLGISFNPIKATQTILEGHKRNIDVGVVNSTTFLLMCSAGIDAMAVHNINLRAKKFLGRISYAFSAIKSLIQYNPRKMLIEIKDKNIIEEGYLVIVSNSRFYGGKFQIDKNTYIDDGMLNILIFKRGTIKDTFKIFFGLLLKNNFNNEEIKTYTGKDIVINSNKKVCMQIDGDKAPYPPAHISIKKNFLPIFVPQIKKKKNNIFSNIKKKFMKES